MPADVITRVNAMAESVAYNRLVFGDRENAETHEVIDSDDDALSSDSESEQEDSEPDSDSGDDDNDANGAPQDEHHDADAEDIGMMRLKRMTTMATRWY